MLSRQRVVSLSAFAAGLLAIALSCTPGPPGPKPGTPEFFWTAARSTGPPRTTTKSNTTSMNS